MTTHYNRIIDNPDLSHDRIKRLLDDLYRSEGRRILATLIRLLGDFDLAEDAMHEAFHTALEKWPDEGIPSNARAWLITTGRFKGIDALRKRVRHDASLSALAEELEQKSKAFEQDFEEIEDDRLRLIFTCCHPALSPDARIALTLREVCGLTTEEIASAFLSNAPTIAQRIVRAKSKIREAGIPYQVPSNEELPERLGAVLHVVYLVFNEGYSASTGESLTRPDLSAEAIRIGRLLYALLPEPEAGGLLALMLLQESRRKARSTSTGEIVLLEDQDRSLWNQELISEGISLMEASLASRRFGPFTLQAAIAAVHAESPTAEATDWEQIVALYTILQRIQPSPVIELNRAVAVAMHKGPEAGLEIIEEILARGDLKDYALAYSAKGELCLRLGRLEEARAGFSRSLELTRQETQRRFLEGKLAKLSRD